MDDGNGLSAICACLPGLPGAAGVYRMLGADGAALYVGKAKNLKKRVAAYARPERHGARIRRMIALTAAVEYTVTRNEAEALLLEANLIRKLAPRYNILLRDDKSFPSIRITAHPFPQVVKHRGAKEPGGDYFGPFASGAAVNGTLAVLHKAFQLRNCTDGVFAARSRPCLQHQIRRCTAPCVGLVTREAYAGQVQNARRFLQGRSSDIQKDFAKKMQAASDALDFESAARWRDRIRALTGVQSGQELHAAGMEEADVFALHMQNGASCVQVFFFRGGHNFGNRAFFPRHERDEKAEDILSAFIAQFYAGRTPPRQVIANIRPAESATLKQALEMKAGRGVSLAVPARGAKKDICAMAARNAREALSRRYAENATQAELLEKLAEAFGLPAPPERVEVYDNSHISGAHAVGAMIVAGPEGLRRSAWRRFNIKDAATDDDFAMMREVLSRRFRAARDGGAVPDLVLVDGGQGQLNAALRALADLGCSQVPVVAVAKGPDRNAGRERFFRQGHPPLSLPPGDPLLHFLQRLRDEAHRFAISSHRAKRSRALSASPLDDVPGIGAKRKKALLSHFGSAKAVAQAGAADLQKVTGISKTAAERIRRFFHADEEDA